MTDVDQLEYFKKQCYSALIQFYENKIRNYFSRWEHRYMSYDVISTFRLFDELGNRRYNTCEYNFSSHKRNSSEILEDNQEVVFILRALAPIADRHQDDVIGLRKGLLARD